MKAVTYISDDGQFVGTEVQVRYYEDQQKNPLAWLRLPVRTEYISQCFHLKTSLDEVQTYLQLAAVGELANLAPDFLAMFQRSNQLLEDGDDARWTQQMMAFISELEPKFMAAIREPQP